MKAKHWLAGFLALALVLFAGAGAVTAAVDPFFHYHAPNTDRYFYPIDNERSQNDGIAKHFEYDAVIAGSSLAANFRTSELDALFGTHAVKLPAPGASFYEVNTTLETAFESQPDLRLVVRSIDQHLLFYGADRLRADLGDYPTYLYDRNPFNDYRYLFNTDVLFGRVVPMLLETREPGFAPGHTSFDDYSNTMEVYAGAFGLPEIQTMLRYTLGSVGQPWELTEEARAGLQENISRNVVDLARAHPDTVFYCFFPPVSLGYWSDKRASGELDMLLEADRIAAELMLDCDNIRLFDFSCRTDLISDVNQYRDLMHYGDWINSLMLKWMHDGEYRLTKENVGAYYAARRAYYESADYASLLTQERYHCDNYAAALLNEELTGVSPRPITQEELLGGELRAAELLPDPEHGGLILSCTGTLGRSSETDLADFLRDVDYIGLRLSLPDAGTYSWLCFQGRNTAIYGEPTVCVYDAEGRCVSSLVQDFTELAGGWQHFAVDLRGVDGPVDVIFHGGYIDESGHGASSFEFRDFMLY